MTKDDLPHRDGLPEHLKILLDDYPRDGWSSHKNFSELTQFWLSRHIMFRKALKTLQEESQFFLDGQHSAARYGSMMSKLGGFFLNQLHSHHHIEDHHYFPLLIPQDARLQSGFDLLDNDHHRMHDLMDEMAHSGAELTQSIAAQKETTLFAADRMSKILGRFDQFLNRHLTDEEELIVPIILKYDPEMNF